MLQRTLIIGTFIPILIGFICTAPATIFAAGNEEVVFVCAPANATGTAGTVTPGKKKSWFNFFSKSEPTTITIDCSKDSVLPPTASSSGATVPAPPKKEGFLERLARWMRPPALFSPPTSTPAPVTKTSTTNNINTTKTVEQEVKNAEIQAAQIKTDIAKLESEKKYSKLAGKIHLTVQLASAQNPNSEYVTLRADSTKILPSEKIVITGLILKSQRGITIPIPGATPLPIPGQQNYEEPVSLRAGEKASIITGVSPNGLSFRLNKCTGGFEVAQNFTPTLPDRCPNPINEPWATSVTQECDDYINKLSSCVVPSDLPLNLDSQCQEAVREKISYNGCVTTHRNDSDFYDKDWRIYLKRSTNLWRNVHETIQLLDTEGKVIDEIIYP